MKLKATMKNKVYYGEYSLKHWVDLILKENIVLPWYQRSFVWDKEQIQNLIKTFDNDQFAPPVVIGAVKEAGEWKNYILDGQQRLTSILFAKCNKFIDKNLFSQQNPSSTISQLADDLDEDDTDNEIKMIKWNFKEIIKNKQFNNEELQNEVYKPLSDSPKNDSFFTDHYLGFAYIKPGDDINEEDQSKFYSDIFRNINTGGTKLTRLETRKSLYFLKEELKDFFSPEFIDKYKIVTSSKESGLIDFIKYLSILSQHRGNNGNLLNYGGKNWDKNESFYRKYIKAVVDNIDTSGLKFNLSYPTPAYNSTRMDNLKSTITKLSLSTSYVSIIEMDMFFFGLVYEILFLNKRLDETKKEDLKKELETEIQNLRNTENHKYNPHALKYLKARINASIDIYKKYRKN